MRKRDWTKFEQTFDCSESERSLSLKLLVGLSGLVFGDDNDAVDDDDETCLNEVTEDGSAELL